jgi:hypothetical protein
MKDNIAASTIRIKEQFPEAVILPCIGNNDIEYHYKAPTLQDKYNYYGDLFNIWFTNVSANANYMKFYEIKETFMQGGYYRYDLDDNVSFLSLNSIYFHVKNNIDLEQADT